MTVWLPNWISENGIIDIIEKYKKSLKVDIDTEYHTTAMILTNTLTLLTAFLLQFANGQFPYGQEMGFGNDWTGKTKQEE